MHMQRWIACTFAMLPCKWTQWNASLWNIQINELYISLIKTHTVVCAWTRCRREERARKHSWYQCINTEEKVLKQFEIFQINMHCKIYFCIVLCIFLTTLTRSNRKCGEENLGRIRTLWIQSYRSSFSPS